MLGQKIFQFGGLYKPFMNSVNFRHEKQKVSFAIPRNYRTVSNHCGEKIEGF
jgi:hypothetical protein